MSWEGFYSIVFLLGGLAEFVLLGVLLARRQYRIFPVFTTYIAFNLLADLAVSLQTLHPGGSASEWTALALLPLQYLLELGVLFEIGWHVVQPVYPSLPRRAVTVFAGLVGAAILGGVLLSAHLDIRGTGIYDKVKVPLDLAAGLLRMSVFAAIAAFAQALGIGWKNKVLQIATALSFYSTVDLVASIIQSHTGQSDALDRLRVAAYLVELGILIAAFTTKEARRREFNPKMRDFLLSLSGRTRDVRAVFVRSQVK